MAGGAWVYLSSCLQNWNERNAILFASFASTPSILITSTKGNATLWEVASAKYLNAPRVGFVTRAAGQFLHSQLFVINDIGKVFSLFQK
jgi:hypothetical protein